MCGHNTKALSFLLFHDLLSVDDVETLGQATAVVNLSAVEGADAASLLLIPKIIHTSVESDYNTRYILHERLE